MSNDPLLQNLPQNLDILVIGLSNNSDKLVNFITNLNHNVSSIIVPSQDKSQILEDTYKEKLSTYNSFYEVFKNNIANSKKVNYIIVFSEISASALIIIESLNSYNTCHVTLDLTKTLTVPDLLNQNKSFIPKSTIINNLIITDYITILSKIFKEITQIHQKILTNGNEYDLQDLDKLLFELVSLGDKVKLPSQNSQLNDLVKTLFIIRDILNVKLNISDEKKRNKLYDIATNKDDISLNSGDTKILKNLIESLTLKVFNFIKTDSDLNKIDITGLIPAFSTLQTCGDKCEKLFSIPDYFLIDEDKFNIQIQELNQKLQIKLLRNIYQASLNPYFQETETTDQDTKIQNYLNDVKKNFDEDKIKKIYELVSPFCDQDKRKEFYNDLKIFYVLNKNNSLFPGFIKYLYDRQSKNIKINVNKFKKQGSTESGGAFLTNLVNKLKPSNKIELESTVSQSPDVTPIYDNQELFKCYKVEKEEITDFINSEIDIDSSIRLFKLAKTGKYNLDISELIKSKKPEETLQEFIKSVVNSLEFDLVNTKLPQLPNIPSLEEILKFFNYYNSDESLMFPYITSLLIYSTFNDDVMKGGSDLKTIENGFKKIAKTYEGKQNVMLKTLKEIQKEKNIDTKICQSYNPTLVIYDTIQSITIPEIDKMIDITSETYNKLWGSLSSIGKNKELTPLDIPTFYIYGGDDSTQDFYNTCKVKLTDIYINETQKNQGNHVLYFVLEQIKDLTNNIKLFDLDAPELNIIKTLASTNINTKLFLPNVNDKFKKISELSKKFQKNIEIYITKLKKIPKIEITAQDKSFDIIYYLLLEDSDFKKFSDQENKLNDTKGLPTKTLTELRLLLNTQFTEISNFIKTNSIIKEIKEIKTTIDKIIIKDTDELTKIALVNPTELVKIYLDLYSKDKYELDTYFEELLKNKVFKELISSYVQNSNIKNIEVFLKNDIDESLKQKINTFDNIGTSGGALLDGLVNKFKSFGETVMNKITDNSFENKINVSTFSLKNYAKSTTLTDIQKEFIHPDIQGSVSRLLTQSNNIINIPINNTLDQSCESLLSYDDDTKKFYSSVESLKDTNINSLKDSMRNILTVGGINILPLEKNTKNLSIEKSKLSKAIQDEGLLSKLKNKFSSESKSIPSSPIPVQPSPLAVAPPVSLAVPVQPSAPVVGTPVSTAYAYTHPVQQKYPPITQQPTQPSILQTFIQNPNPFSFVSNNRSAQEVPVQTSQSQQSTFQPDRVPKNPQNIQDYLAEFENFYNALVAKNKKWLLDIDELTTTLMNDLRKISQRLNDKSSLTPGEEPRLTKQVFLLYKKMISSVNEKVTVNAQFVKKFYLKTHRKKLGELKHFVDTNLTEFSKSIMNSLYTIIQNVQKENDAFYDKLLNSILTKISLYAGKTGGADLMSGGRDGVLLLDDDDRANIVYKFEELQNYVVDTKNKLKSLYNLNYSIMDLIMDSQFYVLYIIKTIRILFTYIALFLTTRVFTPIYEEIVYDQKKPPPALWQYLLIFLGFDIAFNVFLVVVLFLLQFLFKTDNNSFVVDKYLFNKYLVDYMISMTVVIILGILISKVMTDKKYFMYKYNGARSIRSLESIMFYVALVIYAFPFFMIV